MTYAEKIAIDWGTSNLRAFSLGATGNVIGEASSNDGMGKLTREQFEPALLSLIGGWLDPDRVTPVAVCGMAGARQGWMEAAYRSVPCTPVGGPFARPQVKSPLIDVFIVPGLSQAQPADVMRGEETQIAGVLADHPGFSGILCLPGTHSKWVEVRQGRVERFLTVMTGELFALLSSQSVLRHGMAGGEGSIDDDAFAQALHASFEKPEQFAASLFRLRAEGLLNGLSPKMARSRLSGLLIGQELASTRFLWQGKTSLIVGAGRVAGLYGQALALFGGSGETVSGEAMALSGLKQAFALIEKEKA